MKSFLLFCYFFCFIATYAQKPALSAKEYDTWKSLKNQSFSDNGKWLTYEISPYRGDSRGVITKTDSSSVKEINRFVPNAFWGSNFLLGVIKPQFDSVRKMELDKVKKEKMPKDSLVLYNLSKDSLIKIPNTIDYKFANNGLWLAYRNQEKASVEKKVDPKAAKKKKSWFKFLKKKKAKPVEEAKIESDGKILTLWNPSANGTVLFDYVTTYEFSDSGKYIAMISHQKIKKKETFTLRIHHCNDNKQVYESAAFTGIGKIAWNKSQNYVAFLASQDTNSNNKHFSLYHLDLRNAPQLTVLDSVKIAHPQKYIPSNFGQLAYAEDGNRLFFGLCPKPKYDAKDTLTASEKVKLDLWHWQDLKLQPQQLLSAKKDKNTSFLTYYDWNKDQIHVLENDSLKVRMSTKQSQVFIATNDEPYSVDRDHAYPWNRDEYLLMPEQNSPLNQAYVLKKAAGFPSTLSPDGAYVISYDSEKNQFMLLNTTDKSSKCISCKINEDWFEDLNGQIYEALPEVQFEWENDRQHLWLITKYDIYKINLADLKTTRISEKIGLELEQSFSIVNWDKDSLYVNPSRSYILGFSMLKKESNIYAFENGNLILKKNFYANITGLQKIKDADLISYRVATVQTYPDIILDNTAFGAPKRITEINPQQKDFNWANVELVKWKTKAGVELEGLLYTPENLDPNGSYPMIVYYYELNSENIHRHYTPRPTASIVYPTEYCSGGYIIFIPDIRYNPGYPAQGAYDCIMSGTDYVLKKYKFIDSTRMGLQGQSWGGYQSAQLITMTTRYRAAMAGAPVSNMFSAYGGIRWGSGVSRQFQYEHSQSRIGSTIWQRPDLYTLNSPLFGLPKVTTPLLIMHNDNDGAVPWYQGIELFMGLRRLKKPVWLLNYNGDEHNLMVEANRKDLSIRMRAFFDYYLNKGEMPDWMKDGIKAIDK